MIGYQSVPVVMLDTQICELTADVIREPVLVTKMVMPACEPVLFYLPPRHDIFGGWDVECYAVDSGCDFNIFHIIPLVFWMCKVIGFIWIDQIKS